jgi:hypothetical protein
MGPLMPPTIPARGFTMDDAHTYEDVEQEWRKPLGLPARPNKQRPRSVFKRAQVQIATGIYDLINLAGYCVALCGVMALALQCFLWFRDGVWTNLELRAGLQALEISEPKLDWTAAQSILAWALDLPISGSLVVLGLLIVAAAVAYLEPLTLEAPQ